MDSATGAAIEVVIAAPEDAAPAHNGQRTHPPSHAFGHVPAMGEYKVLRISAASGEEAAGPASTAAPLTIFYGGWVFVFEDLRLVAAAGARSRRGRCARCAWRSTRAGRRCACCPPAATGSTGSAWTGGCSRARSPAPSAAPPSPPAPRSTTPSPAPGPAMPRFLP
ncbi:protein TIFY 11b-like [Panicum virgatum]|uniref:protein TIFY 11b-like n=1 Tax=Panicum virgatum TaxID=38727 RepID=UPI0019D5B50B|nr:protein TIFY 11b-like [Panicum virgatum]